MVNVVREFPCTRIPWIAVRTILNIVFLQWRRISKRYNKRLITCSLKRRLFAQACQQKKITRFLSAQNHTLLFKCKSTRWKPNFFSKVFTQHHSLLGTTLDRYIMMVGTNSRFLRELFLCLQSYNKSCKDITIQCVNPISSSVNKSSFCIFLLVKIERTN